MERSFIKMLLVAFAGLLCFISAKYPFKSITNTVQQKENQNNPGLPCSGKSNGNYLIPDVFKYLECENEEGSYRTCCSVPLFCMYNTFIFDSMYSRCRDSMVYNLTNFCIGKANNKYRNPWNCHSFISCFNDLSYNMSCPTSELVYDPNSNLCVDPSIFLCQILYNRCSGKADGKYLISDVFGYLQCSSQQESYVNCSDNQIFDPRYGGCMDAKDYNLNNFCIGKIQDNTKYRNPWNCYSYIRCVDNIAFNSSCDDSFLYDPYSNMCVDSLHFPCRTVNTSENICREKPDGAYPIPDVFAYITCHLQEQGQSLKTCYGDQIFDPTHSRCRDPGLYNLKNFCMEKPDGHYRNPWNCHSFISCLNSISYNVSCLITELVYDPYFNICEASSIFPCKVLDNPCAEKADGKYLIQDVFAYLQCSSHQGSYINCTDNQIFDPRYSNCRDAKEYNFNNFCIGKSPVGVLQYRNPWNCHSSIKCLRASDVFGIRDYPSNISCKTPEFVYDPYLFNSQDICEYPSIYLCRTLNTSKSICLGKPDGAYLLPDVFVYLVCRLQEQYMDLQYCYGNQIFDPIYSHCRDAGLYSLEIFCVDKPDGNYRNPWNCHSSISCLNSVSYNVSCANPELVYDPYFDICEDSSIYSCKVLDNPCEGKEDGNYLIQDVFAYLQCSSQQGSYVNCPDNQIFDPRYSNCMDAKEYSFDNFCIGKIGNNRYRNPWNCHSYITCDYRVEYNGLKPTNNSCDYVYDPYIYFIDICLHPSTYPCRALNMSESICLEKPDGGYLIPDVFAYIYCQFHKQISNLQVCKRNQIFDPIYSNCRDAGLYSLENFCVGKPDGNYRNPWNCHSFISCLNSISYNKSCAIPELVYDPYFDICENSSFFYCTVLDNPCAGKADGNYLIQDVFAYLQCSSQQESYVNCQDNQIFDPRYSNCRDAKEYNFYNFCIGKIQELFTDKLFYRNPWNCHSFITCYYNIPSNFSCSTPELVYDPYLSSFSDNCEDRSINPCRTINTSDNICLGKPDGAYPLPDVFAYITCQLGQEQDFQKCEHNQIFDPIYSKCRDAGLYNFKTFCVEKLDGHYQNPWNCHSYISCLNSISYNVTCLITELVYDPYFNICEASSIFPCKVLDSRSYDTRLDDTRSYNALPDDTRSYDTRPYVMPPYDEIFGEDVVM